MGTQGKRLFEEYVGSDPRIDRFVETCESNGMGILYLTGEKICYVDAIDPVSKQTLRVHPYAHTLTIDLDSDTVRVAGETDFESGMATLGRIIEMVRNGPDTGPAGFIGEMRRL